MNGACELEECPACGHDVEKIQEEQKPRFRVCLFECDHCNRYYGAHSKYHSIVLWDELKKKRGREEYQRQMLSLLSVDHKVDWSEVIREETF
jgi:hypothetical protein